MTATKTKAPREKLTLRDGVDLYIAVDRYVEDHIDEIELNGGALPDDLAAILDEVDAATKDRVDAIAVKIDQFTGSAAAAKATKDRAARREKVWNNAIAAIKRYATLQTQRAGGRLEGTVAAFRMQRNGQSSTELTTPPESQNDLLLELYDQAASIMGNSAPTLARFITVQRVATLDRRAVGAAYETRRAELEAEAELIGDSDIVVELEAFTDAPLPAEIIAQRVEQARATYVADNLAAEFPGIRCIRGEHLRID